MTCAAAESLDIIIVDLSVHHHKLLVRFKCIGAVGSIENILFHMNRVNVFVFLESDVQGLVWTMYVFTHAFLCIRARFKSCIYESSAVGQSHVASRKAVCIRELVVIINKQRRVNAMLTLPVANQYSRKVFGSNASVLVLMSLVKVMNDRGLLNRFTDFHAEK